MKRKLNIQNFGVFVLLVSIFALSACISSSNPHSINPDKYDEEIVLFTCEVIGTGSSFNSGPVNTTSLDDFAVFLTEKRDSFNSEYGADSHKANPAMREKFLKVLIEGMNGDGTDENRGDPRFNVRIGRDFISCFERMFGKLSRADLDNDPDIIDTNDDGDQWDDFEDDDDDGDGIPDWEEEYPNFSGSWNGTKSNQGWEGK